MKQGTRDCPMVKIRSSIGDINKWWYTIILSYLSPTVLFPRYNPFPTPAAATSSQPPPLLSLIDYHYIAPCHHCTIPRHRHTASSSTFSCQPTTIFSVTIEPWHPIAKNHCTALDCHQIETAACIAAPSLTTLAPTPLNHIAATSPSSSRCTTCIVGMSLTLSVMDHNQLQRWSLQQGGGRCKPTCSRGRNRPWS